MLSDHTGLGTDYAAFLTANTSLSGSQGSRCAFTYILRMLQDERNCEDCQDTPLWPEDDKVWWTAIWWRPESPYSLGGDGEEHVQAQRVVMAVPQAAVRDAQGRLSLQPVDLREHRHTSLQVHVPGHPLQGFLFSTLHHPREGQATLQLDFPAAMDYLRGFIETGIHLLEVVEEETRATTRFLVGGWQDPRIPDLPFYSPRKPGGPWFRDINGNHTFIPDCEIVLQ
ncbi:hypothetical protein GWK47_036512 [Chionoecetes opilio]|uniref:Uncharacterized protein n=1 Tax=Chionoecetes opilio TaxID=41210 RepID=A0A8J4YME1_CHIOP|nr:hypothetical protein GWK47_036512 [Chionoecetes opilio]